MAKVVFLQDIAYEYFGIMYISAFLKKHGHSCDVVIEYADKDWLNEVVTKSPDFIAFSVLSGSYKWALEKAQLLKKTVNKPIVFGGIHVFHNPEATLQNPVVDIVCTGEGEYPMKELCDSIDKGFIDYTINGFLFKLPDGKYKINPPSKLIENLDSLPFADRSIYYKYKFISGFDTIPILGARGCPFSCAYCFNTSAKKLFGGLGTYVRERSPENILAEIENCIKHNPQKKYIHFVEDHFGNNRKLTLSILRGLSELQQGKLFWSGAIRIESLNNEEYVKELSKTNPEFIEIAIECGDEKYRNEVLKRTVKNYEILNATDLTKKYGVKLKTLNMIALPGESFGQALKTLDLNIRIRPKISSCFIYQPFPGTELQKYAIENKLIDETVINDIGLSFYDRYWKKNIEFNRIANLQRVFSMIVKFPVLKKPLVAIARNNWKKSVFLIFALYFTWYLAFSFRLSPSQISFLIKRWLRSKVSKKKN